MSCVDENEFHNLDGGRFDKSGLKRLKEQIRSGREIQTESTRKAFVNIASKGEDQFKRYKGNYLKCIQGIHHSSRRRMCSYMIHILSFII